MCIRDRGSNRLSEGVLPTSPYKSEMHSTSRESRLKQSYSRSNIKDNSLLKTLAGLNVLNSSRGGNQSSSRTQMAKVYSRGESQRTIKKEANGLSNSRTDLRNSTVTDIRGLKYRVGSSALIIPPPGSGDKGGAVRYDRLVKTVSISEKTGGMKTPSPTKNTVARFNLMKSQPRAVLRIRSFILSLIHI
eukprot:TRINITY_DN20502_c0_g1_i2.p1 TRINITY_DN20502_c0_g1~~TRINITY_DN20502_c0_g1_i2.p1  ORF type:complete len:208 (-),score=35.41 TRINITY_DN20502_c0_g1_i2:60-626(-)